MTSASCDGRYGLIPDERSESVRTACGDDVARSKLTDRLMVRFLKAMNPDDIKKAPVRPGQ